MKYKILTFSVLILSLASILHAADRPAKRVLIFGIDGCRPDALLTANAPHLKALIAGGAFSDQTNIVGTHGDKADTVSGPGWSNVLTGVWADKHGVTNNNFEVMHYDRFPHFFTHVKEIYPQAKTVSYCVWPPIHEKIVRSADDSRLFGRQNGEPTLAQADGRCAQQAVEALRSGDPDAMFVYFENVDDTGHRKGFHPTVPDYLAAIEGVDVRVGDVLAALHARPNYAQEDWLVIVVTDHGGVGTGHGGGRDNPEVNHGFLIVSGPDSLAGAKLGKTDQVDVVATALAHLGIMPKPDWQLDGRAVGLR